MQKVVYLIGSSFSNEKDLFSFIEDVGFLAKVFENESSIENPAPDSCHLLLIDQGSSRLKLARLFPHVPIVMVLQDEAIPVADTEGVFAYVQKPFRWSEVLLTIHQALPSESELHSEIQVGDWIDFSLSSNRAIFQGMRAFLRNLLQHSTMPSDQVFHINHAICEILLNAMEHGNRFDPRKRVKCSYVLFQDRLVVKIEDQGCGFFPDQVPNPLEKPSEVAETRKRQGKRPGGYGLALANRWMTLDYSDRGNSVLLTRVF